MAVTPKERRDTIREAVFTSRKPKSKSISFRGADIEIRQPSVRLIMDLANAEDKASSAAKMLINFAYVPGTDIKIFDMEDTDSLLNMPFDEDWKDVNEAIAEMTGVDLGVEEEGKNSE